MTECEVFGPPLPGNHKFASSKGEAGELVDVWGEVRTAYLPPVTDRCLYGQSSVAAFFYLSFRDFPI